MNKNLSLSLQLILIGCLTFFIHELVHFLAHLSLGALLGIIKSSDEIKTSIAMGLPFYFWTSIVLLGLLYLIFKAKNKIGLKPRIILIHFTLLVIVTYLFSLI